jgi:hypothetical protein
MAHIINLATQAFLTICSTSKHYDPASPNADIVIPCNGQHRGTISLIHAIAVELHANEVISL